MSAEPPPDCFCCSDACFVSIDSTFIVDSPPCPSSPWDYLFKVKHKCGPWVGIGGLCEADGECGSDQNLNNCLVPFHGYVFEADVYTRFDGTCNPNYCPNRRFLKEEEACPVHGDIPLEDVLKIIQGQGAKAGASFSEKDGIISKESCDALIDHFEASSLLEGNAAEKQPWIGFEDCFPTHDTHDVPHHYLHADDLVQLIGADETLNMIDFFESSFGDLDIHCMYIARHGDDESEDLLYTPWHTDSYADLEVTLNNDYEGGQIFHLNDEGVHNTAPLPGSAFTHGRDTVHGMAPNSNGAKYQLILKHRFDHPDKEVAAKLSKEIIQELAPDSI